MSVQQHLSARDQAFELLRNSGGKFPKRLSTLGDHDLVHVRADLPLECV